MCERNANKEDKDYLLIDQLTPSSNINRCLRYFDDRIRTLVDLEISIGDYVLTGGELASMVCCDAIIRLLEGAIRESSHEDDSFSQGLLEYPQYTRPEEFHGQKVPEVLLSGHHENIRKWREQKSLEITKQKRPDLLK